MLFQSSSVPHITINQTLKYWKTNIPLSISSEVKSITYRLERHTENNYFGNQREETYVLFTTIIICCTERSVSYFLVTFNLLQIYIMNHLFLKYHQPFISYMKKQYWIPLMPSPPSKTSLDTHSSPGLSYNHQFKAGSMFFHFTEQPNQQQQGHSAVKSKLLLMLLVPPGLGVTEACQILPCSTQCDTDHSEGTVQGIDSNYTAKSTQLIACTFRK